MLALLLGNFGNNKELLGKPPVLAFRFFCNAQNALPVSCRRRCLCLAELKLGYMLNVGAAVMRAGIKRCVNGLEK